MSFFGRIMESMRLSDSDDDDYFLDDEYDDEEDERPPRKSLFGKRDRDDEYYDDDDQEEEAPRPRFLGRSSSNNSNKVVPIRRKPEVSMVIPTSFADSQQICADLLAGKVVIIKMEGLHTEVAQRIIDFVSGTVYSISGNLQKISNYIFIATSEDVDLSGDFEDILAMANSAAAPLDMTGLNLRL